MGKPLAHLFCSFAALLCGLIGIVSALPSDAIAASEFRPTRYPFLPELTLDEHPTLCAAFLGAATRVFLSEAYLIEPFRQAWPDTANPEVVWLDWNTRPGRSDNEPIEFIELDFGAGRPAIVISHIDFFRRPDPGNHNAVILVNNRRTFDALADRIANVWPYSRGEEIIDILPETFYGHAIAISERSHPWAVLEHGGRYFIFNADPRAAENPTGSPDPLDGFAVHEIQSDMTVRTVCVARAFPFPGPAGIRAFREARRAAWDRHWPEIELPDAVLGPPELLPLYHTLSTMLGSGVSCPSQFASYRLRYAVEMAKLRVAFRPWVRLDVARTDEARRLRPTSVRRVRGYLAWWSLFDPWRHQVHDRLDGELAAAREALTAHYRDAFGVSVERAEVTAWAALDQILIRHFQFNEAGAWYAGYADRFARPLAERIEEVAGVQFGSRADRRVPLVHEAVRAGRPAEDLVRLIESEATGEGEWRDFDDGLPESYYPVLANALEHPGLMRFLLDSGAEVDHAESFGKTALIYAAQFDLPDAVAVLLEHRADIESATTTVKSGCSMEIARGNRTALTYAVEYASLETIRLLLDAGARADVEDSLGNSLPVYLEHNTRLSAAEAAEAKALLSDAR